MSDDDSLGLDQIGWSSAFQVTPDVSITVFDYDGCLRFFNEASLVIFGRKPGQVHCGLNFTDLFHPDYARERIGWIREVIDTQSNLCVEHIYLGRRIGTTICHCGDDDPQHVLVFSQIGELSVPIPPSVRRVQTMYADLGKLSVLSPRELEVFVMIGHGMRNSEIAKAIHRSEKTIESHRTNIGVKLGIRDSHEIVRIVTQNSLDIRLLSKTPIDARLPIEKPST